MQTQKQTAPVQGKVAWLWVCKARPPRETVSNRKSWPKARHVAVAASRARSKLGRTKRDPRAWQDGRGPLVRALGLDCPKPARSSAHAQNGPAAEASPQSCTKWSLLLRIALLGSVIPCAARLVATGLIGCRRSVLSKRRSGHGDRDGQRNHRNKGFHWIIPLCC
jgi:hypothetical protein